MNLWDILILLVVFCLAAAAVRHLKRKKTGCCDSACSNCPQGGMCKTGEKKA